VLLLISLLLGQSIKSFVEQLDLISNSYYLILDNFLFHDSRIVKYSIGRMRPIPPAASSTTKATASTESSSIPKPVSRTGARESRRVHPGA